MDTDRIIKRGYNPYLVLGGEDAGTSMDVGLLVMEPGDVFPISEKEKEVCALLLEGDVEFCWQGTVKKAGRPDCFRFDPWALHLSRGVRGEIRALTHAEIYIQMTGNERDFESRLYAPEDVIVEHAGAGGELMGCMRREIKTVFDYDNAPWSNMVVGEVLNFPGRWSSYPPHHHPQPEVYFYRFDHPQGFGASFANGSVQISHHNGLTVINHGFHSQVAAPGYAMCYVWGIRHLPGDPWRKTRIDDEEHAWLWAPNANDQIFKLEEK